MKTRKPCPWHTRHHSKHVLGRHYVRHHLYRQIYFGFMAVVLVVCVMAASLFWIFRTSGEARIDAHAAPLLARLLPADISTDEQAKTLHDLAATLRGSVALYDRAGRRIAMSGTADLPAVLDPEKKQRSVVGRRFRNVIQLPDGRQLMLRWGADAKHIVLIWLAAVALVVALGTWPVARRLTRRLEKLQQQADAWGDGRLSTRMAIDGCDEVAELARRFNQAAERVEALVSSQRAMLASASHELRSPLARIRMATDLLGDQLTEQREASTGSPHDARPDLQAQIGRDIAELDALIGDLLLASRLAEDSPRLQSAPVDLLGLAAEEASRIAAIAGGETLTITGDARLLRHLIRNLLDNARRHGQQSFDRGQTEQQIDGIAPIEIEVYRSGDSALLRVLDRGPGVPEAEREKVFEPFYRLAGSAERGEGTGYGLALVQRIARLHGGEVRCLPRNGGGACFEVRLGL